MAYFAAVFKMKGTRRSYNPGQLASAVFMILALVWLTVSAPFVVASQQAVAKQTKSADNSGSAGSEEEAANAFGNSTEEKKPSSNNSLSEEYLHDHHTEDDFFAVVSRYQKAENAGIYTAFHGEVQVPPPNQA